VVVDQGPDVAGNPCPVVDRATGTIFLVYNTNPASDANRRSVWVTRSDDDGLTWSAGVDVTADVKGPRWSWYAVGPGRGVQLFSGRLVVPADHHDDATGVFASHVLFSGDGVHWQLSGSIGADTDEAQVAQLSDGGLLLSARDLSVTHRRASARSADQGQSWGETTRDPALNDPSCEGSLLATPADLLFSNPDSASSRTKLTVRVSHDDGVTWPVARVLHAGPAAYSSLAPLKDGRLACLYEQGEFSFAPYDRITLARFTRGWLEP
jgi:sialidase-1